jgi:transcription elongation GreA/GreB family factor
MSGGGSDPASHGLDELVRARIEKLRPKLLDLSRRNPLVATRLSPRSSSLVRVVDELPDVIANYLFSGERRMRLVPLPPVEQDPRDEQSRDFQDALSHARVTDPEYLTGLEKLNGRDDEEAAEIARHLERSLRDRLRVELGMGARQAKDDVTLVQHARNNEIAPSYDLPTEEHEDGRHTDDDIQTLLLPADLERKLNSILSRSRTWTQETGINVLHAAFGFVEWTEPNASESSFAPLVLLAVEIEKVKAGGGYEFRVTGVGEPETNLVFAEKLKVDFGIDLQKFSSGSLEQYFSDLGAPARLKWKIRRQIAFGIFPSARMAMYLDLDTSKAEFEKSQIVTRLLAGGSSAGPTPFAGEHDVDEPEIERQVPYLVLDADSSQFSTIVDVSSGTNLAVEGPPGTGKSQTIVNVIAAAIAAGKKVLFVAEKTAALDVVKSRLEAVGLGEFVLPLQADRSTREAVMTSIRDRLMMEPGSSSRQLGQRIAHYRQIRSEIAAYVEAVSSTFAETGFKIYDILGKFIATNDLLNAAPKPLHTPKIPNLDRLSAASVETIRATALAVESSWKEIEEALPHWRGVKIASADRFTVDRLLELATAASTAVEEWASVEEELRAHGFDGGVEPEEHELTAKCIDGIRKLGPTLDVRLLAAAHFSPDPVRLGEFLALCKRYQTASASLTEALSSAVDAVASERLKELHQLCEELALSGLTPAHQQNCTAALREALQADKTIHSTVHPFVGLFPPAAQLPISAFTRAKAVADSHGRHVLALRSNQLADIGTARLVREIASKGRTLREQRERLGRSISIESASATTELRSHAAALRQTGWLSFLSPSFRAAKKIYLALSRDARFVAEEAAQQLQELADHRDAVETYERLQPGHALFGLHFRGIETDFDPFLNVVAFFEAVEERFAGMQLRDLRNLLKSGDVETLQSIPEIPDWAPDCTFAALVERIERQEQLLATRLQTLDKVAQLTEALADPAGIAIEQLPGLASRVDETLALKARLDGDEVARLLLQADFQGAETDPYRHQPVVEAIELLRRQPRNAATILSLLNSGRLETAGGVLQKATASQHRAKIALNDLRDSSGIDFANRFAGKTSKEIFPLLQEAARDPAGVFVNARHVSACADLGQHGLAWVVDVLREHRHPLNKIGALLEAVIFRAMALRMRELHGGALFRHAGDSLNARRKQLAELDREIIKLSRQELRVKAHAAGKPPSGIGLGRKSTWTDMALITNEVNKKKKFIPVRDLTRRAGAALLELKPCWMMSPLAVAQYLPRGGLVFDLCIIDEASQMPPEDAIGALSRCGQVMVVGDTNQLPPSSFFKKLLLDGSAEEDDDETVLEESILEIANGAFRPARRLRWHYRSRHSGLIQFSNKHVYDGDLIVFPSTSEDRPDMGVSLVPVRGRYKSSINPDEATAMVQAIVRFMRTNPDRSLGVVTLNQPQKDLLDEEMNTVQERDPAVVKYIKDWQTRNDGLEPFFIKNLENVQGDERDVIFIGTVYGAEQPGGPVMQRFGPINGVAGKRRLNVLFSRAKQQIVTFSSMTAADIHADQHGNPGVFLLKQWLEYSATGVLETGTATDRAPDSDFEIYVADQVRAMGCTAVPQVGAAGYFIDIGVKHPQWPHGFIMGIECDGASYHSSRSARDRDRLREEVLVRLGWKLHRIWSTDWFNDPRMQAQRLRAAIEARLEELKAQMPAASPPRMEDVAAPESPSDVHADVDETEEVDQGEAVEGREEVEEASPTEENPSIYVEVGDTVSIRYLSGAKSSLRVTISRERNDPKAGIVHASEPLATALLGAEEGEEVSVLVGSSIRKALVESVSKGTCTRRTSPSEEGTRSESPRDRADLFGQQRQSGRSTAAGENGELFVDKSLDPARFYESDYRSVLQRLGIDYVDQLGPMTFKHLADLVARAHGFRRTGDQIQSQVWAAVSRARRYSKPPAGGTVFWPKQIPPRATISFRGMTVNGQTRVWSEVPYPEKLGLAVDTLRLRSSEDPITAMASKIGLTRLRESTRTELQTLLVAAQQYLTQN